MKTKPTIGPARRIGATRIDDEEFGAIANAAKNTMKEDGVCDSGIRSPEHNHIGVFDLSVRRCAATGTEHCGQTDHARSVSSSVTGVDVVGAQYLTCELLSEEVHFVGGF